MRILGMTPSELLVMACVYCIPAIILCLLVYLTVRLAVRHELKRTRKDNESG